MAAEYAIKSLIELDSNSTYNYIEALLSSDTNKEINQLIEYLVFYWLAWSSSIMHSLGMPRTLNYIQLPPWLRDNFFLKKFHEFDTKYRHLNTTLNLPEGFKLSNNVSENNIDLVGEHLRISIVPKHISYLPVRHFQTGKDFVILADIPIRKEFEDPLKEHLGSLIVINIVFEFEISLSRFQGIFRKKEFIRLSNWSSDLKNNFVRFFGVYHHITTQK